MCGQQLKNGGREFFLRTYGPRNLAPGKLPSSKRAPFGANLVAPAIKFEQDLAE